METNDRVIHEDGYRGRIVEYLDSEMVRVRWDIGTEGWVNADSIKEEPEPAGRYVIVARARARSAPQDEDTVLVRIRECPQTPFATFLTPSKGGSLIAGNYFEHPEFAVADWKRRATRDTATVAPHKAIRALRHAA